MTDWILSLIGCRVQVVGHERRHSEPISSERQEQLQLLARIQWPRVFNNHKCGQFGLRPIRMPTYLSAVLASVLLRASYSCYGSPIAEPLPSSWRQDDCTSTVTAVTARNSEPLLASGIATTQRLQ